MTAVQASFYRAGNGAKHTVPCGRCGRPLSNPVSVALGIGPVCRAGRGLGRMPDGPRHTEDFGDRDLAIPLDEGIVLRRDGAGVATNVPHLVVSHSPDGYEFGYGGSGPADLALNIVEALLQRAGYDGPRVPCYDGTCFELAWRLHQAFKWKFVAPAPREGLTIPLWAAMSWLRGEVGAAGCELPAGAGMP